MNDIKFPETDVDPEDEGFIDTSDYIRPNSHIDYRRMDDHGHENISSKLRDLEQKYVDTLVVVFINVHAHIYSDVK